MKKIFIIIGVLCGLTASAQDYLISFTGTGLSSNVNTVKVENLTAGTSLMINGTDVLHLTSISTAIKSVSENQIAGLKVYPNPMTDHSVIEIFPPVSGVAGISVSDLNGNLFIQTQTNMESSKQEFSLSGLKTGIYFINVRGSSYKFSTKIVCSGNGTGTVQLQKMISNQAAGEKKSTMVARGSQGTVEMRYNEGERLKFTGTSGNYSTVKIDIPVSSKTLAFDFMECRDGDNNNYPVVVIGTQAWMASNLKTTKYHMGEPIGGHFVNVYQPMDRQWILGDNETNLDKYGRLYNKPASQDSTCPIGWRLPIYSDWRKLTNNSDSSYEKTGVMESIIKFPVAKSLASTTDWLPNNIEGSVGNSPEYNNSTGFTVLPGANSLSPNYGVIGEYGSWFIPYCPTIPYGYSNTAEIWSENNSFIIHSRDAGTPAEAGSISSKGNSIRCIKGSLMPDVKTSALINIKTNSAESGGLVSNDTGYKITARGVCWSTSHNPTTSNSKTADGLGTGTFISSISGLSANSVYYLRAYASNSAGTSYGKELIFKTYSGTVTDIDGNVYYTVIIGSTEWMAENLKTTKYRLGEPIGGHFASYYLPVDNQWVLGNDAGNLAKYGRLYNKPASQDSTCPIGWRLPIYSDWRKLTNGADSTYERVGLMDSEIKFPVAKSLAATTDWLPSNIEGSVGNSLEHNNSTGFTGLPGANSLYSNYGVVGEYGSWFIPYCSTIPNGNRNTAEIRSENNSFIIHSRDGASTSELWGLSSQGNSIRCIKGTLFPDVSTYPPSIVSTNSAESEGYVSYDGGRKITARGVCWSTSHNPTTSNNKTVNGSGTGVFVSSITGLSANTTYYLRAYATNSTGTSYSNEIVFKTFSGTVSDIDGNTYNVITMGTQDWTAENLKTTRYNNGNSISNVTDNTAWSGLLTGGYCNYDNSTITASGGIYASLYNFYAAVDPGNLCPAGWHVPTDADWTKLTDYLTNNGYGFGGSGDDIAKSMANTTDWNASATIGAPGKNRDGNNNSGFNAIPGGDRSNTGEFSSFHVDGTWWSSTTFNSGNAWFRNLNYNRSTVNRNYYYKTSGFSVRCLKN